MVNFRRMPFTVITGVMLFLWGVTFSVLGLWLVYLGGSWYYAPAGVLLVVSGALMATGRLAGCWLYGGFVAVTAFWSLFEVGTDGWKLMPRLLLPAVFGVWCCTPWVVRPLSRPDREDSGDRATLAVAVCYAVVIAGIFGSGFADTAARQQQFLSVAAPAYAAPAEASSALTGEWQYYGRTEEGQRYSPLTQITAANVGDLQLAWRFDTGDEARSGETEAGREFNFEVTPVKVGNRLFICTPHRQVIALDATTGKLLWKFDPHADLSANEYFACRGVAYYASARSSGGTTSAADACRQRIITTTGDARMVALDALTGRPCDAFGNHGFVSLTENMGKVPPGFHFITSQPLVIKNRIVLGGWIYDNQARGEPSGVVRAFDAATGKLDWAWDMGRQDPTAPLGPGDIYTRGTPNGWGTYTADPALGLVYVPLGNATPDYYGAQRRTFDDEYSSALVALDIQTGKERWHFQTVHHDVWDFDLPIGPSLVDLTDGSGNRTPALVQTTKMGQLFLLDRRTGKPLADVVEKPVPTAHPMPGERLSPTQPYSVGLPSLAPANLTERDTWGATPSTSSGAAYSSDARATTASSRLRRWEPSSRTPHLTGSSTGTALRSINVDIFWWPTPAISLSQWK
ncbi:PQQ-binding-like beta-propeller repeat protein [Paraburkholderia sabiae]|uniref:PQQ-binding-like beta-propeller repeat protein n=1 Tax=Paraburkholderia sabiae TaxID=273251 RepID=A0ABU9QNA0_9BURK|nr:PQQ-binding-like beta-propeller repeat protein [Paraburkholderia sabiae]CAD6561305.1 Quinate/shikimate dehydrogenase (quinone) [Paraburkholderia sabiae]